jgi:hypothetical protein
MKRFWALVLAALVSAVVLVPGSGAATTSADSPRPARAAGEDSPWPRTNALRPNIRAARKQIRKLAQEVELMELSVARYHAWDSCLRYVPVSEYGDAWENRFGYLFDARDGTGVGFMDALAIDRFSRPRKEDYMFIDFDRQGCRSDAPEPGGTAEPASVRTPPRSAARRSRLRRNGRPGLMAQVAALERRAERLSRRAQVLEAASERFDAWESCVSWVPVTQEGDEEDRFGYLFGSVGAAPGYRPALHIDRSDWDDPDYQFLALVGGDRPGRSCKDEPGEAPD